ncbi:MAG: Zn-dependent protease, partial [Bacteroidota bacterium]
AYAKAEDLFPENEEMKFWHAVTLANTGKVDEALPLFRLVFAQNADWKTLVVRLRPVNLLTVSDEDLSKILSVIE